MHTQLCANSIAKHCDCNGCDKKLHGWRGSHRFAPLIEGRQHVIVHQPAVIGAAFDMLQSSDGARTAETTDYLAAKLALWPVETMWSDDETNRLVLAFADSVAPANRIFVDALAASAGLTDNDRERIRAHVAGHLICVLSVALLEAYDTLGTALDDLATVAVRQLAADLFTGATEAIARAAAERVFKLAARQLTEILIDDVRVIALRFVGAVSCPDWYAHPGDGIWTYCLKPAFLDAFGDKEKEWAGDKLKAGPR
ncbi:hypothetical protein [Curtobacterium sp. MCBA15_004]|uniref:hypothetical protein n=1 Tax=Curtobacterium sp. MCBA15_004 TaxID=1898733 RepID=UPI0011148300|nr:hypothetical protein [Curtobacterium sp. MCBA15_004]WIA97020.1 hypothetical protein QOL16_01125 [Curtobacterium sp. MCBA15_004]